MVEDAGVEGLVERASRGDAVAVETLLENELPHKEVAERLGRSELATRTLLHRALAALSATLDEP